MSSLRSRSWLLAFLAGAVLTLQGGCDTARPHSPAERPVSEGAVWGYTYQSADGNRIAQGRSVLSAKPLDIALPGAPVWLVGAPRFGGAAWVAVLADGSVVAFQVEGGTAESIPILPRQVDPSAPPVLVVETDGTLKLVNVGLGSPEETRSTGLVELAKGLRAYVTPRGDLVVEGPEGTRRLGLNAMPNARPLTDGTGRVLLLIGPTDRYRHDVLGGNSVASGIVLVETEPDLRIAVHIDIPAPAVVEGNALIWADVGGDPAREIVTTLSDAEGGSSIVAYDESGVLVARSEPIGQGFRWRHQLSVARFASGTTPEIATVMTPHIGGVIEFFRLNQGAFQRSALDLDLTSHRNGSSNIDMAVAGDFDDDGETELIVPTESFSRLAAVRRVANGVQPSWTLEIGGRLVTNLATVTDARGRPGLGVGHDKNALRIWPGQ